MDAWLAKREWTFALIILLARTLAWNAIAQPGSVNSGAAQPTKGTAEIRFETNFFDFGKITGVEKLSGAFKFKNVGDGVLKLDPPEASCECTVPELKNDTIAPGQAGEISYTVTLDRPLSGQRLIRVHSNDPKNPNVNLTIQLDYTPLYELEPRSLWVTVPPGKDEAQAAFTISRPDGKRLEIDRLTASHPWINAAFDSSFKSGDNSNRVIVVVHRPSTPPAPFNASVMLWKSNRDSAPVQTVAVNGEVFGEFAAVPSRLYWVIPDFGNEKTNYPAEALTRTLALKSVLGQEVEVKKITSTIEGMKVLVIAKQPKKLFDLVLKFDELPRAFANGKVTVETSLPALPKIEIPVTIAVPDSK